MKFCKVYIACQDALRHVCRGLSLRMCEAVPRLGNGIARPVRIRNQLVTRAERLTKPARFSFTASAMAARAGFLRPAFHAGLLYCSAIIIG
jgi:hypothetical protein